MKEKMLKIGWGYLMRRLSTLFKLNYTPSVSPLAMVCGLIELSRKEDAEVFLATIGVKTGDFELSFHAWSPGIGTLINAATLWSERWLLIRGVPLNLWSMGTFQKFVKKVECEGEGLKS